MMKEAHAKGLEEMESERNQEGGDGGGGEEGEGEGGEEGEGEEKEEESIKENVPPPSLQTGATGKRVRTTKKRQKSAKLPEDDGQSSKRKVKVKGSKLKAPPVADSETSDNELEWTGDRDFETDILSSARKATIMNSGSITKRKPVRRVYRRQRVQRLAYDSDEDDQSEEEGEGEREGERGVTQQKVPSRFILSDDDN